MKARAFVNPSPWKWLVAAAVLLAGGSGGAIILLRHAPLDAEAISLGDGAETYCVGRYFVDVPRNARAIYGPAWISGVDIETRRPNKGSAGRFASRERELRSEADQEGAPVMTQRFLHRSGR
ncbi:hypothetical protein [Luteimonas endophytica]|uniref:hypothetical protein n=1 Tax=Luteimonas endophytica TaxID=3042023 RepID=UPI003CE46DCE